MPDSWIHDHTGAERRPRPGFEDELAADLGAAWHGEVQAMVGPPEAGARGRTMLWIGIAAALLMVAFVSIAVARGGRRHTTAVVPTSVVSGSSTTEVAPSSTAGGVVATNDSQRIVLDYLGALAASRWDAAAKLLGEGGLELKDRLDLRPIYDHLDDLAGALQRWCAAGGRCELPTSVSGSGTVMVHFRDGARDMNQAFTTGTFEGHSWVRGLPQRRPLRPGEPLYICPTTTPLLVVPADLDGDGWFEQVEVLPTATPDTYSVTYCGTSLRGGVIGVVDRFSSGLLVYPVDVRGNGVDQLLIGSTFPDGFEGRLYAYSTKDGHYGIGKNVMVSQLAQGTLGCTDVDGDGLRDFVSIQYTFVGGTNSYNGKYVQYVATPVWPLDVQGTERSSDPGIPTHTPEAVRLLGGYCGDRLIMAG